MMTTVTYTKPYLARAHEFIVKNKLLFLTILALNLIGYILVTPWFAPTVFANMLILVINYFYIKLYFLLPLRIHESKTSSITKDQVITSFKNDNWKSLKAILGLILLVVLVSVILAVVLLPFGVQIFDENMSSSKPLFGFYLQKALVVVFLTVVSSPMYIFPIFYFLKKKTLWESFKLSVAFTGNHKQFILPVVAITALYYFLINLFVSDSNYFLIPLRVSIESYLGILISVAIYYYYTDHPGTAK